MNKKIDISILESLPSAILLVDINGVTEYLNKKFTEIFNYSLSDISSIKDWWSNDSFQGYTSEQEEKWNTIVKNISEEETNTLTQEFHLKCHNSIEKHISVEYKRVDSSIILIINDVAINKQISSEFALVESEERMSSIFDNAPVAMLLLNGKREVLQINKKGLQYLRKSHEDSINQAFGNVYRCITTYNTEVGCGKGEKCKECLIKRTVEDTFNSGKTYFKVEVSMETQDGIRIFHLSTALLNLNGRKEVLTSIDDITDRKSIELQLKFAKEKAEESDKLKTAFLQNMSHEIRTPLNGILGFSGLLNNKDISEEEKIYYLNVINESSNQLLSIVDNILSLSRMETEQMEVNIQEVNLNDLIGDLFFKYNAKAKEKNILFHMNKDLSNNDSIIFTDSSKIQLTLENLLDNAIKFTHEGHIKYGYNIKDESVEFFVEDTGIGIEEIYFKKIFERFQQIDDDMTRKYGGTGLGLTIAKGNAEILGGKLWLESNPGEGSTFYFNIPYKPVNQSINSTMEETVHHDLGHKPVILVAEDEEINYLFIEEALKDEQVQIIHAFDGREAVDYCKDNSDIRLVLMDIKMPHMDGYMALSKIKEFRPELPLIAQTAYAFFADKQKALEAGFNDYISKPIKKEQLIEVIQKYTS